MEFKIVRVHNAMQETITKKVGSLSWTDSMDSLGVEFSFTFPYSYWDSQFKNKLQLGDLIIIKAGKKEITRCIITQTPINGDDYRGYDYAFYPPVQEDRSVQSNNPAACEIWCAYWRNAKTYNGNQ